MSPIEGKVLRIPYERSAGPLPYEVIARPDFEFQEETTNCQRGVQLAVRLKDGIALPPGATLSAEGFEATGVLVSEMDLDDPRIDAFFDELKGGDIIWAEPRLRRNSYPRGSLGWKKRLHMAYYIGEAGNEDAQHSFPSLTQFTPDTKVIFHGTVIEGATCLWEVGEFTTHYLPVRARRIEPTLQTTPRLK